MNEDTQEQYNNSISEHDILENEKEKKAQWLAPFQYKKGQTGNPSGRPKGQSLKEWARNKLLTMTEDEREDFLNGIHKSEIWKMSEGNPDTKTDITTKGEKIEFTPAVAKVVDEFEEKLKGTL
jgi:hypothetical protein